MSKHPLVVIAGGGPAGVGAAIGASGPGNDVLLIEQSGFFGGMGTAGLVQPWMAYKTGGKTITGGLFGKIVERLKLRGAFKDGGHLGMTHHCFDPEILKIILQEMLIESDVDFLLHTSITGVDIEDGNITGVHTWNKSGAGTIKGVIFIDATGDADLSYFSGVPCEKGRPQDGKMQPASLHFRVGGVDESRMPEREEMTRLYLKAKGEGRVSCPRENLLWFDTPRKGEIHFNTTRVINVDGTSGIDLTRAEIESRRQMEELTGFLKSDVPGFENCYLDVSGSTVGIRETRRIKGEYQLTADDIRSGKKFPDAVALGCYGIDIHLPDGKGTRQEHLKEGEYYSIPYRALLPSGINNLLVCGRCISSTHEANAAIRIQPTCYALGEAAGTAARLCIEKNQRPKNLDAELLRQELKKNGSIVD
ncbi:MAG: FAD-dependent oxidoreductase [Chloroflexi bacterium]|nr:FAD-dependent oxidoreductase [Chloroflexota bacterium]